MKASPLLLLLCSCAAFADTRPLPLQERVLQEMERSVAVFLHGSTENGAQRIQRLADLELCSAGEKLLKAALPAALSAVQEKTCLSPTAFEEKECLIQILMDSARHLSAPKGTP